MIQQKFEAKPLAAHTLRQKFRPHLADRSTNVGQLAIGHASGGRQDLNTSITLRHLERLNPYFTGL
jgi:hypothetical protein